MRLFICEVCGQRIEPEELHKCYCGFYCHKKHLMRLIKISFGLEGMEMYELQMKRNEINREIEFENTFDE